MKIIAFILLFSSTFQSNTIAKSQEPQLPVDPKRPKNPYKDTYSDTEPLSCMKFPNRYGDTPFKYNTTVSTCLRFVICNSLRKDDHENLK